MESNEEKQNQNSYYEDYSYGMPGTYNSQSTEQRNSGVYVAKPSGKRPDAGASLPQAKMNDDSNGYAIASLILGILSIVMVGLIQGILAIVFGKKALKKNQRNQGCAIAGIVTGGIGLGIFAIVAVLVGIAICLPEDTVKTEYSQYEYSGDSKDTIGDIYSHEKADEGEPKESHPIGAIPEDGGLADKSFNGSDGSELVFNGLSFTWYKDEGVHDDNYRYGFSSVYYGEDAREILKTDLSDYGVTEEELDDYFERNEDDSFYNPDCFCVMILHNVGAVLDKEESKEDSYDTPYMGFYSSGYYDAVNMNSGNYAYFSEIE